MSEHELWNELGNLYFMSGTYQQAAYAYNRAIQLDAGFGRPYCNLALTYVKQGRFAEAVDLYQHSIEVLVDETEKAVTWYRLGDVYRHLKNYRDAIMAYQQADLLKPELSQDRKESEEILYGGSGEGLPAETPILDAAPVHVELPLVEPEPAEATLQESEVTETEVIHASLVVANVTETPLLEELAAPAAVTESAMIEAIETEDETEPGTETIALLDVTPLEAAPIEDTPMDVIEQPAPEMENSLLETEPQEEPILEAAVLEEPTTEAAPLEETPAPAVAIEIVYEQCEQEPVEAAATEEILHEEEPQAEIQAENETFSHLEMIEPAAETMSMPEEPAPATETIINPADRDLGWIDDDFLLANFEHETDVYIPGITEEQLDQWLPLEPEPMPEPLQPEGSWNENRMQIGVEPSLQYARRLPGTMIHESWEPALPLASSEQELPLAEEPAEDLFIVPGEEIEQEVEAELEPEVEVQPEAEVQPGKDPDPLQTADELEQIEDEIGRWKYVVQNNPRNASAWDVLGTLYKSAHRYRDAIMAYQQAVAVEPNKAPYHHHLGILYAIEGLEEEAMKAFQDVIEIDPNHSLANATLGGYYRKMGLEELAQRHIGKAMKNFYNSENEYNKACLEALCGNIEQSIELLRVALKNKQTYVDWVLRDPDLDSIRKDPRFKQLISDYMV